ncbi:MAG: hypothetical protein ABR878_08425 [Roseiarcus sp.]
MSDVVMVLGMHRSGTSAVAGALTKLGGGLPKHLMAANPSNARGFFESVAFMNFHDELLESAGSNWRDWRLFNPGWDRSPVAVDFRRRAKDLFMEEFNGSALPVLKDPRICRLMPFWLDVLRDMQATPHIAMPIRSPLDVAQSLKNVHGLSLTHGLLLWLRHVLDAESQSRSEARSIFTWRDFRSDWRGVCDKIAAETHLSWPRLSDRASRDIDRFLTKQLVNHDTDDAALVAHPDVHEWTLRAYEALLELARNPLSNSALATLDDLRMLLDQSSKIFGRLLIDSEIDLEEARGQAQAATSERDALRAREIETLTEKAAALAELAARVEQAEKAREEAAREKEALAQSLAAALAEREALRQSHDGVAAELQSRRQELAEKAAALAELVARAQAAETAFDEAAREKEGLSRTLAAAVAERDALGEERVRIAAELQSRQRELAEKAAALAELVARAQAAETAFDEAAREKEGLSQSLAAAVAEREAQHEAHAATAAELRTRQEELAAKLAVLAELAVRAEAAERAREQAARDKDGLSQTLAAAVAELADARRDLGEIERKRAEALSALELAEAERDKMSADLDAARTDAAAQKERADRDAADARRTIDELTDISNRRAAEIEAAISAHGEASSRNEELARALQQMRYEKATALRRLTLRTADLESTNAARIEAEREARDLTQELESAQRRAAELAEKRGESLAALDLARAGEAAKEAARVELAADLDRARQESQGLAFHLEQVSSELQRARELASDRAAAREAAHVEAIAAAQNAHDAKIHALRAELVDAEAALASARARSARKGVGAWLTSASANRRLAKRLLRSGLFDAEFYRAQYPEALAGAAPDGAKGELAAAEHYVEEGFCRGYRANPLFDTRWYLERNEDVRRSGVNPLLHYFLHGWREGRDPGPGFQTDYYLEANPDVRASGANPLAHYLRHGRHEGRLAVRPG